MTEYPDYIGKEAVRRLDMVRTLNGVWRWPDEKTHDAVQALCQLLTETGFKEPEPRDLVFSRSILNSLPLRPATSLEEIDGDIETVRALLREYAGEEA